MTKTELVTGMREYMRELDDKIRDLQREREATETALTAITNGTPIKGTQPKTPGPKKRIQRRRRRPASWYDDAVLKFVGRNPDHRARAWSPAEIADALDLPSGSVMDAINRIVKDHKVTRVGDTPKGNPVIKYRTTTVRPGEAVTSVV